MYEVFPKKSNKNVQTVLIALIAMAAATMLVSCMPNIPFRSLLQLAGVGFLVAVLAVMGRYIFSTYIYAIVDDGKGGYDLSVTEIKRKSRITVCRISVSGIDRVVRIGRAERASLDADMKGRKRFNYGVDIAPAELCCIFAEECGERVAIFLSVDDKLIELLTPKD